MELTGKIKEIGNTQAIGANNFKKRELVITTDEQYPQHILIEANQDKCEVLDKYHVGQIVKVSTNIRGREWPNPQGETKYFNSIQLWRIDAVGNTPQSAFEAPANYKEEEHDVLPF